jgi:dihydropteroate synthase
MLSINCKGRLLSLEYPVVMGIINATPDSFYEGSRKQDDHAILKAAEKMLTEGATFLDIGGQSTRPGSERVSEEEETDRVIPAIEAVTKQFPEALVSVDTYYAGVAKKAVEAGASLVNDVSAGALDKNMISTVAALKVPYVLMHMKGDPSNMQVAPHYDDVALEVFDHLNQKAAEFTGLGLKDIIVDPGFGFGKTSAHNFQLLDRLSFFRQMDYSLMVGLSRKATVYKTLGTTADEALNGSTVLHTVALMNGANILRVHDVKPAMEAVKLCTALLKERAAFQLL